MRRLACLAALIVVGCSDPESSDQSPAISSGRFRISAERATEIADEVRSTRENIEPVTPHAPEPPDVAIVEEDEPRPFAPLRSADPIVYRTGPGTEGDPPVFVPSRDEPPATTSAQRIREARLRDRGIVGEARYITTWQAGVMRLPLSVDVTAETFPPFDAIEEPIRLEKGERVRVRHVQDAAGADVWLVEAGEKGKAAVLNRASLRKYVKSTPGENRGNPRR